MKSASRDQLSSVSAFADFISRGPLGFHPSSQEMYSALAAFSVMVAIIEKVSGLSAEEFFQKEIFIPCSMTDTTFLPTAGQWSRIIAMSNKKDGRCVLGKTFDDCVFCDIPASACLGGAGLISTLDDYANFAEMLRSGGTFGGKRILSQWAVVEMATPQAPFVIPTQKHWGLSFGVTTDTHPRLERGCFGWSGAFGTVFWVDPANDVVAIYMKNSYYDGGEGCCTSNGFEEAVANALI